ncbi:vacuolar sorting receptor protein, putative [Eimeria necatrix]|uniref:Vacuolar sorting receptor protein, putative n=1 Tax=Eimeria necatrix TaxID=51315 RepID=U6MIS0_9EIME|nr:vacuolar sorting receptor protein, putative [Eimeria necatrix]CDJ63926.1 vacuolar sorting receptor protein, putative [Eimeria necatrix]
MRRTVAVREWIGNMPTSPGWRFRMLLVLLAVVDSFLREAAEAQLRPQSPKSLLDKLIAMKAVSEENFHTIIGSTASFGTPTYGTTLRGRAFYVPDEPRKGADGTETGYHCNPSYCALIRDQIDDWKRTGLRGGLGNVVLFVDRGICTFAAKVEVAQSCGADAVVVVDQGAQGWTREMIRHNIIMSDDGKMRDIRIPSILISKVDGKAFEEEILAGKEPVLVELEWRMPAQWPVAVNFWADPGDVQAASFLQALAPYMLRLGAHVRFQTIYNVFSLGGGSEELCLSQGLYEKYPKLYCAFEPNAQVLGLTGSEVVQEALLQSCLYWATKVTPSDMQEGEFSREWWLYHQRLGDPRDGCSFSGTGKNAWGPPCSKRVLSEVLSRGQLHSVELCMTDENGRSLLEFSKNNRGWTIVAMTINGARYSGQLATEPVLRAICSATANPLTNKYRAEECNEIVIDAHTEDAPWLRSTMDSRNFVFILLMIVVVCLGLSYLYYRYAKKQLGEGMQQRVQHEVQQQLQLYHRMEEAPGKPTVPERSPLV